MEQESKSDRIADKCAQANCTEAVAKRHHQLFVFENWDVHPPQEFISWLRQFNPGSENPVPAWNSARTRQEYLEWIEFGQPPAPPEQVFDMKQAAADFRAAMSKIEGRVTHSRHGLVVPEDTREKGYDQR